MNVVMVTLMSMAMVITMVTMVSMVMVITMVTRVSMVMVHYHGHETTLPRISCSCTKPKLDLLVLDNVFDEAGINGCCVSAASRLSKSRYREGSDKMVLVWGGFRENR